MRKKLILPICAAVVLLLLFCPPEIVRVRERAFAADFVKSGDLEKAQQIYRLMRLQRDPVGISNYHALTFHASINAGRDVRKTATSEAIRAWKLTGADGVGASYWNLAMFSVNYGQNNSRERKKNTHWLKLAGRAGVVEADKLLSAGNRGLDRVKILMKSGDAGAALTWKRKKGLKLFEVHDALRIAANAGHVQAMRELGWSLILNSKSEYEEAEYWLVKAASAGEVQAANRLGNCHNHEFYFCDERDPSEAAEWYEIALKPPVLFSPPSIEFDSDYAIKLGSMPRWYSKPLGHQSNAAYELGRLLMEGDGVAQDLDRAQDLLEQAGGWKDAEQLLARLRAERAVASEN